MYKGLESGDVERNDIVRSLKNIIVCLGFSRRPNQSFFYHSVCNNACTSEIVCLFVW